MSAEPITTQRQRRFPTWAKVLIVAILISAAVFALVAGPVWLVSKRAYSYASEGKAELMAAQTSVGTLNIDAAFEHTAKAEDAFLAAQEELSRLSLFSVLPVVGKNIEAAGNVIESGLLTVSAIEDALAVADEVLGVVSETEGVAGSVTGTLPDASTLFKDLTPQKKREVLAALERSVPLIESSLGKIDEAIASMDLIPTDELSRQFAEAMAPIKEKLTSFRATLQAFLPVSRYLPPLLGYPEDKRYLVFFQNNTELRPTGGFLGVYGTVHVKDAELIDVFTDDIYALDGPAEESERPEPPEPIRKYIGIDKWYLRDANWSPDFTESVKLMERFYLEELALSEEGGMSRVDGVIAVTPVLASDILRLTGPITIDDKTFDADNLVDELEFAVERGFVAEGIEFSERKAIVGELFGLVIDRLSSMSLVELTMVVAAVHQSLEEGHLLLSMKDPGLQRMVLEQDWGGALLPIKGDYFSVIDANLASLKSDPFVARDIAYGISPNPVGTFDAEVAITYTHSGGFDWKTTRYRTYTRLYVPAESEFLTVEGAMVDDKIKDPARRPGEADVVDELGRRYFGAFISIEPGESRTLTFRYRLAPSVVSRIAQGLYSLDVEKQAGTVAHGLTLSLDFGKKLTDADPAEDPSNFGDSVYDKVMDLRVDRHFDVQF